MHEANCLNTKEVATMRILLLVSASHLVQIYHDLLAGYSILNEGIFNQYMQVKYKI